MGSQPTKLPVYDDFGNPVQMPLTSRTYERRQGCWNCIHGDAGDDYLKRVDDLEARNVARLSGRGLSYKVALRGAALERMVMRKKRGFAVLCTADSDITGVEGDFVLCKHICTHWSGKQGVHTPGSGVDKLVEELYDDMGETPDGEPK